MNPWQGGDGMRVEIKIDASCKEPKVIIVTEQMTEEIAELVKTLSEEKHSVIAGFRGSEAFLLEESDIIRIYTADGRVFAETADGEYQLRLRLYELEARLGRDVFVRISNSEIINLKKVKRFDLSYTGTICISLSNGTASYVSRRYVAKIKQVLGI